MAAKLLGEQLLANRRKRVVFVRETERDKGALTEVQALAEIANQWFDQGCFENVVCPAIECEPATGGSCQPASDGMTGICETLF